MIEMIVCHIRLLWRLFGCNSSNRCFPNRFDVNAKTFMACRFPEMWTFKRKCHNMKNYRFWWYLLNSNCKIFLLPCFDTISKCHTSLIFRGMFFSLSFDWISNLQLTLETKFSLCNSWSSVVFLKSLLLILPHIHFQDK